ncbi:uncharacterized protein MONBRDRAFT_26050 [Monosiga brevicollis MX1]|uniref:Uncharacterized protein n=1 Tax=Monosiga brevicollis TaxID=81824 RepID=A9V181_MONBE|nr:uncharacterized protein MONBRDRAFT_26050 [Monosiga brevicollis MX1]EDQ88885.1 predicted protein [Monosiga brevicollis MX1]|eukprot:XP_001746498.1 hypothetical protein [Monosiga brevicollis MX1]
MGRAKWATGPLTTAEELLQSRMEELKAIRNQAIASKVTIKVKLSKDQTASIEEKAKIAMARMAQQRELEGDKPKRQHKKRAATDHHDVEDLVVQPISPEQRRPAPATVQSRKTTSAPSAVGMSLGRRGPHTPPGTPPPVSDSEEEEAYLEEQKEAMANFGSTLPYAYPGADVVEYPRDVDMTPVASRTNAEGAGHTVTTPPGSDGISTPPGSDGIATPPGSDDEEETFHDPTTPPPDADDDHVPTPPGSDEGGFNPATPPGSDDNGIVTPPDSDDEV